MLNNLLSMTSKLSSCIKPAFITVFPWLITGLAMIGAIMIIMPRSGVMAIRDTAWLDSPGDAVAGLPRPPVEPAAQDPGSEGFGGNPAQGSRLAPPPVDSVSALNTDPPGDSAGSGAISSTATERASAAPRQPLATPGKLTPAESRPSPAAGSDKASASTNQGIETSGKSAGSAGAATAAINELDASAAGPESRETTRDGGPWVINLASSRSKESAERFRARAGTRGIAADLHRVSVKGTEYWRVQVTGFATAAEAKAEAGLIKEKLALDDVWIVKQ
ncbi:MAG: SPOR domain-containing protein [Gammaproteobacteria bacterium]